MQTIEAIVKDGRVITRRPVHASDNTICLVTVLDEDIGVLRRAARARLSSRKQQRLTALLSKNKHEKLTRREASELDELLSAVQELTASRARALWALRRVQKR